MDISHGTDNYNTKIGLAGNHAYSFLTCYEVVKIGDKVMLLKENQGKKVFQYKGKKYPVERVVKLRNPWGKLEWKGAWNDNDPIWTPSLKQQLGHENKNDGIFFMNFVDFIKYFRDIQICKYKEGYKYSSV